MEGKTHRVGGVLTALGGYYLLKDQGYLVEGVSPILQLAIIYPFSIVGSLAPDQDHHEESAPMKDVISMAFCKLLHLTTKTRKRMAKVKGAEKTWLYKLLGIFDARHRSWQTHSDLSFLVVCFLLYRLVVFDGLITAESIIVRLISTGFVLGLISHLVLDMLTPSGVWSIVNMMLNRLVGRRVLPEKIRFVPNTSFFATGGKWEELWRWGMGVVSIIIFFYLLYDLSPYQLILY